MIFLGPQQALIEMDQCDYYWRPIKGSLYKYVSRDGMIRDRNAGAIVIDDVDKLRSVLVNHRRVWIVLPQEALNSQAMSTYVSENCNIVYKIVRRRRLPVGSRRQPLSQSHA